MTREEAIKKHRELWHWIANEHRRRKSVWVQKIENPEVAEKAPRNQCWLCEYTEQLKKDSQRSKCDDCPIKWGKNFKTCEDVGSPYFEWFNNYGRNRNYEDVAKLADTIAELPEKGD